MKTPIIVKIAAVAAVVGLAGCTDLKPLQAEVDSLKSQVAAMKGDTDAAKALRALPAQARIALTGTPVENSTRDLWSIYQFILPGYLGGREQFKERFEKALQSTGVNSAEAQSAAQRLRRLVRRLQDTNLAVVGGPHRLTVSQGVTTRPLSILTPW